MRNLLLVMIHQFFIVTGFRTYFNVILTNNLDFHKIWNHFKCIWPSSTQLFIVNVLNLSI